MLKCHKIGEDIMTTNTLDQSESLKNITKLSFKEEMWNSITHGVMAIALLIVYPYVAIRAFSQGGTVLAVGDSIFILSLFSMFLGSTLYHAMPYDTEHKYVFRILDHVFIFVAIAGTYTPIALTVLPPALGYTIVALQWAMTLFGIFYKIFSKKAGSKVSLMIYLAMGWMAVFLVPSLIKSTSPMFIGLLIMGGVMYSIGAWFYAQKDRKYFHTIWHIFINLASICHFVGIVFFMI